MDSRESEYVFMWYEGDSCPICGANMVVNSEEYDHHGHDSTNTWIDCTKCNLRIHPVMFIRKEEAKK